MTTIAGIGFTAPWLLLALLVLPVLWLILRAVPPAPLRRMFPGVVLLLGLRDDESVTDRTPWWLLLLRMLAIASPTDAVVAAQRSVMADIDANLVELSATMDATATVIAAGTRDAATSLSDHAEALEALAEGLEEAFAPPPMLAASNP